MAISEKGNHLSAGTASAKTPYGTSYGDAPYGTGYEEGSLGWVVDQPTFIFPDGSVMKTRLTAGMHLEVEGRWRLVHMHLSVGVPDEQVVELQQRWMAEGFSEAR